MGRENNSVLSIGDHIGGDHIGAYYLGVHRSVNIFGGGRPIYAGGLLILRSYDLCNRPLRVVARAYIA